MRREIAWGVSARLSLYLLVSRSNIDNQSAAAPFDYDDKNYLRFIGSLDVLKTF